MTDTRPAPAAAGGREASPLVQVSVRALDAPSSVIGFCCAQESSKQRELDWLSACCTETVCRLQCPPCASLSTGLYSRGHHLPDPTLSLPSLLCQWVLVSYSREDRVRGWLRSMMEVRFEDVAPVPVP